MTVRQAGILVSKRLFKGARLFAFARNSLGGMTTPRRSSEIIGGDGYDVLEGNARVMDSAGEDVTEFFIRGAQATLLACKKHGVHHAVLKAKSPSCGAGEISRRKLYRQIETGRRGHCRAA